MENSVNSSNCASYKIVRARSRRKKVSNLSTRLQPDFDVKNHLKHIPAPQEQDRSNFQFSDEEFIKAVKLLNSASITNALNKILHFLVYTSKELAFPNISDNYKIFLVHIATDSRYLLHFSLFNSENRALARQILDALDKHKSIYKLTYSYEDGLELKDILVYKKIYFRDFPKTVDGMKGAQEGVWATTREQCGLVDFTYGSEFLLQRMQVSSRFTKENPSPFESSRYCVHKLKLLIGTKQTLSSSLEDLNITDKDISTVFKIKTLNTTLKFIKNDNQLTVEYADMLRPQAEFVNSLFCQRSNGDVGLGFKSLYSPLLEAVKEYSKVFNFQVSMRGTRNGVLVTVRKIPKNESKERTDHSLKPPLTKSAHNSSLISDSSNESESLRRLTKPQREFIKKQRLIHSLPNNYVKSCLQSIVNFMNDPLRASLEFNDIGSKESRFLQSVTTLAKKSENHQHFKQDCVPLLKSIAQYKKHDWSLSVAVGKVNKTTGLRAMSFQKVPACENGVDTLRSNKQSMAEKNRTPNVPKQQEIPKNKSAPEKRLEDRIVPKQSPRSQISTPRAISRDRRNRPVMGISFQTAGNTEYMDEDKEQDITIKCARKSKLYQDMSTPLESDKAERMMVMMGWKGGALGARGDGITEPIIPPLHLSKGAGLGHIRPVTRTGTEFRRAFLNQLQSFLGSSESETATTYNPLLTKQERKFVNDCLSSFNDRKLIGVCFHDEVQMANKILEVLKRDQCLQIQCSVSEDKTSIKLCKTKTSSTARKTKSKKKTTQNKNTTKSDISIRIDELIEMFASQHNCSSAKSVKSLAYRIIFLENIKEFLGTPDVKKEYILDCIINTKQRTFVQMVVNNVNRREIKVSFSSVTESDIYREIRRAAEDCYITVTFDSNKLIMQKRYYQKRFTNSALLPPPVSKDLKNTIIYKNNVAITINQNGTSREVTTAENEKVTTVENGKVTTTENEKITSTENEKITSTENEKVAATEKEIVTNAEQANYESDDDVILIEQKTDIIVISDSESPDQSMEKEVVSKDCDQSKYSIDSNITNESVLLQMLEEDNDLNSTDSKLERDDDIKQLVAAMEAADKLNIKTENIEGFDDLNLKIDENDVDLDDCVFKLEEEIVKSENGRSEVNNNLNLVRNKNVSDINDEPIQNLSQNSSKRSRSLSDDIEPFFKISKCNKIKKLCIAPKNYPKENMTRESVQKFQLMISDFLDKTTMLPLIECHGVQDGGLIYSCHNEKSLLWLENFISVANLDLKIYDVDTEFCVDNNFVVKFKINSFIKDDARTIIDRMELYNTGLDTRDWKVLEEDVFDGCVVITVEIDSDSLKFISENNFCLFLGVDRARFSVLFS